MKKLSINNKLIISLFLFFIISLISIYSAKTISSSSLGNIFVKQLIYYGIGIIILLFSYYKKNEIFKYHFIIYLTINFLLLILLILGVSINGSRCWIIIGPFSFQPSEFMKISLIITISKILSKTKSRKNIKKEFLMLSKIFIIVLIPSILTFLEPDTGVVIIYLIIMISMILYQGINKKWYIIILIILSIISGSITFLYFFKNDLLMNILGNDIYYRLERILNWSKGSGYQLENSLIAIGASGFFGFGFNNTPLYFPEASTDFIFATFSSNFGFLGSIILITIIIIFDNSIISLINNKTKLQDKYFLVGVFSMIVYQQFQNISMTIGLLPITGITLPFISYGGSSLLSYMFITGLILRIANNQKKYLN